MSKFLAIGLGAAAVVVIGVFLGVQLLGSPNGGTGDEPTPSAIPSTASAPSLTQSFTSTLYGISLSYPEGWIVRAGTEPWTESRLSLNFTMTPVTDVLYDPELESNLFLAMASQPIADATPDEWVTAMMAGEEGCDTSEPITVDGASGLIGTDGCDVALVTTADRGYWIQLYTSPDDPLAVAAYDRAWFEAVLATVQLQPEDAVG